ncbi:MAG TPA: hypothetical protein GXX77_04020 [Candidatus Cloacimonetes bacterium]|nr:hypothetical protein [Candidatus Cloacimonadota bacterium]
MKTFDKKGLAAISAVMALISSEDVCIPYTEPVRGNYPHPWSGHSRSQIMQYRDITQRRIIKRSR